MVTYTTPFTPDERLAVSQTLRAANVSTLPDIKAAIRNGRDDEHRRFLQLVTFDNIGVEQHTIGGK